MRFRAGAVLLLLVVSGCLGGGKDNGPPTVSNSSTVSATATLGVTMERPEWVRGQFWQYAIEVPAVPTTRFKMVVAEDADELWIVGTDDRAKALNHALYSTNPVLGRITKSGLSPYQSGTTVEMFRFPLADRMTWGANFFGEPTLFQATYDDAIPASGGVYLPGFRIEATGTSGAVARYNYVEAIGWFSDFQYVDAAAAKRIHLSLEDFGAGYRGPYTFLRGEDRLDDERAASTALNDPLTFNVTEDDGFDGLGLGYRATGLGPQPALVNLTLRGPDDTVRFSEQLQLSKDQLVPRQVELGNQVGMWRLDILIVGPATVETRAVGLAVFQGTV